MKYCFDFNNYYFYDSNYKLNIISQKEYIKKTGESRYLIDKLKNSIDPYQANDYFLLKPPFKLDYDPRAKNIKTFKPNNYIPVDWKYKNIIKFFWDKGLRTTGINQPKDKKFGFINFRKEDIEKLIKLIGKDNLIFLETKSKPGKERREENLKYDKEYPNDIRLVRTAIYMSDTKLKWLHKKFNLKFPNHKEAHKGARMRLPGHFGLFY